MTFEEEFPSLKDRVFSAKDINKERDHIGFVSAFTVQNHTLDKQRVREAIEKIKKISDDWEEIDCASFFYQLEPIFKELMKE